MQETTSCFYETVTDTLIAWTSYKPTFFLTEGKEAKNNTNMVCSSYCIFCCNNSQNKTYTLSEPL